MLIVRFRQTFRERATEWVLSAMLMGWGAILLGSPEALERPFYELLARTGPSWAWGAAAAGIGAMRLVVLFINGGWWRTPTFRQIGCIFGLVIWAALAMGALAVEWRSPGVGIYTGIFILETLCLSFAARDGVIVGQRRGGVAHGAS